MKFISRCGNRRARETERDRERETDRDREREREWEKPIIHKGTRVRLASAL